MEIDHIHNVVNKLTLSDGDDDDNASESEDSDHSDRSEDDENQINFISRRPTKHVSSLDAKQHDIQRALNFLIQNLTQEKLEKRKGTNKGGTGKCFWCDKPGHWAAECRARKAYLAETAIHEKHHTRSKGKPSKGKRPQRPLNNKGKGLPRRPKIDPNAMIYNILANQYGSSSEDEEQEEDSD